MVRISLIFILLLFCEGCASNAIKHSQISKISKPVKNRDNRLVKYAISQGCKMMESGYMVCPK